MAIRWSKKDLRELRKNVQRFNAKITRTEKKNPAAREFLPERLNVRDIQEGITERRDLNNLNKSINRFMQRGAENLVTLGNGVVTTKWQKRELEIKRATVNRQRAARRKVVGEVPERGMGTTEQYKARPLQSLEEVSREQWDAFVERIEKEASFTQRNIRDERYLANWTQGLFNVFGEEKAMRILAATENLSRSDLITAIIDNDYLTEDFIYDLTNIDVKMERMITELGRP